MGVSTSPVGLAFCLLPPALPQRDSPGSEPLPSPGLRFPPAPPSPSFPHGPLQAGLHRWPLSQFYLGRSSWGGGATPENHPSLPGPALLAAFRPPRPLGAQQASAGCQRVEHPSLTRFPSHCPALRTVPPALPAVRATAHRMSRRSAEGQWPQRQRKWSPPVSTSKQGPS